MGKKAVIKESRNYYYLLPATKYVPISAINDVSKSANSDV
jgi:hypothetical protein